MFHLLHRLIQGVLALLLAWAMFLLWQHRELGLPLVDLYVAWEGADYHSPDLLPRSRGTVSRILEENVVEFRDREGRIWNVGLAGLGAIGGDGRDPVRRKFAQATRTNLVELLVGRPVEMAWITTNANRTGLGFIYLGTNSQSLALQLVEEGRLRWMPADTRVLPLLEQMRLRGADRRARTKQAGLWNPENKISPN